MLVLEFGDCNLEFNKEGWLGKKNARSPKHYRDARANRGNKNEKNIFPESRNIESGNY